MTATRRRHWEFRRPVLPRFSPAATQIAWICLAVFVIQFITLHIQLPPGYRFGNLLTLVFGLHWPLLRAGCFWQPVTYNFLHGSWVHIFLNLFSLLFFGSAVERLIGTRRFWLLYLASGVIGGLGWMLFNWLEPHFWIALSQLPGEHWGVLAQRWAESQPIGAFGVCVGASAAVFGLIGAFAALCPDQKLFLLLFLVIPLKLRARTLALLLMVITLVQLVVGLGQVAYAAHLFGGLAGYLLARRWRDLFLFC